MVEIDIYLFEFFDLADPEERHGDGIEAPLYHRIIKDIKAISVMLAKQAKKSKDEDVYERNSIWRSLKGCRPEPG